MVIRLNFLSPLVIFLDAFVFFFLFFLFNQSCLLFQHYFIFSTLRSLFFCNYLEFSCFALLFLEKFKPNHIDLIPCEIDLGGVLTTFYKVIRVLACSKTCTTKFYTSMFWRHCQGIGVVEFLTFIFCFYFSLILFFYLSIFLFLFLFFPLLLILI